MRARAEADYPVRLPLRLLATLIALHATAAFAQITPTPPRGVIIRSLPHVLGGAPPPGVASNASLSQRSNASAAPLFGHSDQSHIISQGHIEQFATSCPRDHPTVPDGTPADDLDCPRSPPSIWAHFHLESIPNYADGECFQAALLPFAAGFHDYASLRAAAARACTSETPPRVAMAHAMCLGGSLTSTDHIPFYASALRTALPSGILVFIAQKHALFISILAGNLRSSTQQTLP